jgi:hypothetical protein
VRHTEEIDFLVDSSIGELEVWLFEDGWASFGLQERTEDDLLVEEVVRKETDVAACFRTLGLPSEEANQLAAELWEELDEAEQAERARLTVRSGEPDGSL